MTQWMTRLTGLIVAVAFLGLAGTAQAQGLTKKLIGDIGVVDKIFQEATDALWEATEIFQTTIFPYAEGDIPILTKNWEIVKGMRDSSEKKLRKQFKPLRGDYLLEMEKRVAFMDGIINDPARTLGIKDKFTTEDIDKIKKLPDLLKIVVDKDTQAVADSTALIPMVAPALEELTKAIKKKPMKAMTYKKQIKKLKKAQTKLEAIPPEGNRQIKAADAMGGSVARFLEEKVD